MEVVNKFYTSIVNRIFGYLEYILLNGRGNIIPLSATTTAFSITALKPAEGIEIDKNETSRKIHHYLNNDRISGINNRFKKKEILQKKINLEFENTEPARYCNDIEILKTATMKSNGLYHGIFYENMVGYCSSKIV
ncbi:hypothetical protein ACI65C_010065 [Semiaphis heraclei]